MSLCQLGSLLEHSLPELFLRAGPSQEVTIGRADENVLVLTSDSNPASTAGLPLMLSRLHAKLAVRDGHLQLFDCGSVNGTWCNTQQLQRKSWKVVQDGDVVTFGGPPEFRAQGTVHSNPWRFKVRNLHEFLASWPPTQQRHVQALQPPPVEVFRFSNLPAAAAEQTQDVLRLAHPSLPDTGALQPDNQGAGSQQACPEDAVLLGSPEVPLQGSPILDAAAPEPCGPSLFPHQPARQSEPHHPAEPARAPAVALRGGGGLLAQPASAPASNAGPDVIDLTMDDDSPLPRRPSARKPPAGAGSPHKRREHGQGGVQEQAGQPKRAKPVYIRVDDDEAGPSNRPVPAAAAAAAAQQQEQAHLAGAGTAPATAAAGRGSSKALSDIQSQFTCAICQEMLVHAMVLSCGHLFCGECLATWLAKKKECPTCRQVGSGPPVWVPTTDSICNDVLEKELSAEDLTERKERKESWEQNKERLERALKAPWEQRGGGGGGRSRGGQRGDRDLLGAVLEMVRGGGSMLPPEALLGAMPNIVDFAGPVMPPPRARMPAAAQQARPLPPQQFRVEYARGRVHANCAQCHTLLDNNVLRIGVAPAPTTRREQAHPNFSRWYHLDCMPHQLWREARVAGVQNMRGISPSDQAQVRARQQTLG